MTFLPIVERELRVATRRPASYWSRVIAALVAIAVTVWMLGTLGTIIAPDLLGARMFKALASLAYFCCLFPGVVLTADCLSEEKRAGTLGLLFLTDLKGYDVVWGKLMVTSLRACYALLAIFPLLAVPFFVGGVTPGEFWRMVAVLGNTLFLSLALGMFFSAVCWQEQRAMLGTATALVALTFVLPLWGGPFAFLSPQSSFLLAFDAAYILNPIGFVMGWVAVHGLGWVFLWLAGRLVMESWQKKEMGFFNRAEPRLPWRSKRNRPTNPVAWLHSMDQKSGWIWFSLGLPAAVWLAGYSRFGAAWWNPMALLLVVAGWHTILQFWIAWEASRSLNHARRCGLLEQVLATPLGDSAIVEGLIYSLERHFIQKLGPLLLLDLAVILFAVKHFKWKGDDPTGYLSLFAAFVGTALVQSHVLSWLGLWLGLKSAQAAQAALATLLRGVLLPTGLFLVAVYAFVKAGGFWSSEFLIGCSGIWVVIGGSTAYLSYVQAQKNLQHKFRDAAVLQHAVPSWFFASKSRSSGSEFARN